MSHITKIKTKVTINNEKLLLKALELMTKEGYQIKEKNGQKIIDLSDRCTSHYSNIITIEKEKDGTFCLKGDPYSIHEHFHTAVNNLQKNYQIVTAKSWFAKKAYAMGAVKEIEKTDAKHIGKIVLTGTK